MKLPSVNTRQFAVRQDRAHEYDRKHIGKSAQQSMHMGHMHISIRFMAAVRNFFMVLSPFVSGKPFGWGYCSTIFWICQ